MVFLCGDDSGKIVALVAIVALVTIVAVVSHSFILTRSNNFCANR
jgi:hypothetical protein